MADDKKAQFTPRDFEVSAKAWACLEGDAKLNYEKLATLGGYKNPASARESWRQIKNRLMAAAGVDKDGKSKGQELPETPTGKATSKTAAASAPSTATKRKRATRVAATPVAAADSNADYEDEDGDDAGNGGGIGNGSPAPPKKPRRTAAAAGKGRRKKKAIMSEEIIIEPVFDEGEEQRMQKLRLADEMRHEGEVAGVNAMVKAEEHDAQMMALDEV
ncbi:hypothetical protein PG994_009662 [Apiospora phragmitis]|uniref:Myb-like domain-containing protein n=1 Tax=Apiospora phragmitis TaxID=2905665 RepID=A0ABR1U6U2_9PEZI